ncbi:hypothetical protein [Fulvivirga sp.]|uniref:hypothetical protein n=1 Tax=Fulvivirga sp. TaxID=1931237 RepID=UPI0032EE7B6C
MNFIIKRSFIVLVTVITASLSFGQDNKWVEPLEIDTTILMQNHVIKLRPTETNYFEPYYLKTEIIDSLRKRLNNHYEISLAIETLQMSQFEEWVKRDGNDLFIKLNDGKWFQLIRNPDYDETGHSFEFYFEDFGFFSIRVQWGEGNAYKLINSKTGEVTNIIGRPFFSPDGSKIIALGNDIEATYSTNGFQLLSNNSGKITELGKFSPTSWGCKNAKWISNDKLILINESIEFKAYEMNYFDFCTELIID